MDQVAALHWIQENIREFGGDERNVTIMGQDHGAACVNFLMLWLSHSKQSFPIGLFHRAIMQSGSALSPWAIASDAILHAKNVAKAVGCTEQSNINGVLECLRHKSVQEITSIALKVPTHLTAFGPVIDGIVIPSDPQTLMSKPNSIYGNYPLLIGITKVESYNQFSMYDERHGVDVSRRDRLLRTLVRNLFNYHLQVSPISYNLYMYASFANILHIVCRKYCSPSSTNTPIGHDHFSIQSACSIHWLTY